MSNIDERTEFEQESMHLPYQDNDDAITACLLSLKERLIEDGKQTDAFLIGSALKVVDLRRRCQEWYEEYEVKLTKARSTIRNKNKEIRELKATIAELRSGGIQ